MRKRSPRLRGYSVAKRNKRAWPPQAPCRRSPVDKEGMDMADGRCFFHLYKRTVIARAQVFYDVAGAAPIRAVPKDITLKMRGRLSFSKMRPVIRKTCQTHHACVNLHFRRLAYRGYGLGTPSKNNTTRTIKVVYLRLEGKPTTPAFPNFRQLRVADHVNRLSSQAPHPNKRSSLPCLARQSPIDATQHLDTSPS